jgi:hypothetical protein
MFGIFWKSRPVIDVAVTMAGVMAMTVVMI